MKKIMATLLVMATCLGCTTNKEAEKAVTVDSVIVDQEKRLFDSLARESVDRPDDEQETPSIAEERELFVKKYDDVKIIDSLLIKKDNIRIFSKYYCLKNEKLIIPSKYVFEGKKGEDFVTHKFANQIRLTANDKVYFDRIVSVSDFELVLPEQLKKYGVLLGGRHPNIHEGKIQLNYSISIPVTDIGVGVSMIIDKDGKSEVLRN